MNLAVPFWRAALTTGAPVPPPGFRLLTEMVGGVTYYLTETVGGSPYYLMEAV